MNPTRKEPRSHIVADGRQRVIRDEIERVRSDVRARYAEELTGAGFFRRLILKAKIRREIRKKLGKTAPRGGLYARH